MEWTKREKGRQGDGEMGRRGDARQPRASWAAVGLAALSCLVQGINFVRNDIAPLLEATKQTSATLKRIEVRLADHERRLAELERRKK